MYLCRFALALLLCLELSAAAQEQPQTEKKSDPLTVFPHPDDTSWYVAGQFNSVFQMHPAFHSPYSGANSLRAEDEADDSRVFTLYTGYRLTKTTEILLDGESSGGRGISEALGLAGYTNLDVVRNPFLGATPYLARLMLRQIIPLGHEMTEEDRDFLHLAPEVPVRRLELRVGKFSLVDFFDLNSVGSDSHLQFLNWTVDNNGAYDYAADTRGYTWAAMAEYYDRKFAVRFAEALMPKVANGLHFETSLSRARAENLEFEFHPRIYGRSTIVRLLAYANHANMGDYRESIGAFEAGLTPAPDITFTRRPGRVKFGLGLNLEQELPHEVRWFLRYGWNQGQQESFVYTEADHTIDFGADVQGNQWGRKHDRGGAAFVSNGLSDVHRQYLALGGLGFLLGDGRLTYGRETIFEGYYTAHLWRGVFGSLDLQHINNPGYNRDRGPVWVPALRLHVDF